MKMYGQWEFGKDGAGKPEKGWYSKRPGVAQKNGFDAQKYGGPPPRAPKLFEDMPDGAAVGGAKPRSVTAERRALPIGLLFPGQNSQYVKMLSGEKDQPVIRDMFRKAQEILGYDILEICLKGPEELLNNTKICQPVMFLAGMAALEKLRAEKPQAVTNPQCAAGLSVGEYTALCAAGVFSFEDGLRLVKLRAEAMTEAAEASPQLMLSVAGIDKEKLSELCVQAARSEGGSAVCTIANELFSERLYLCRLGESSARVESSCRENDRCLASQNIDEPMRLP